MPKKKASKKTAPANAENVDNEVSTDDSGTAHVSKAERQARLLDRSNKTK